MAVTFGQLFGKEFVVDEPREDVFVDHPGATPPEPKKEKPDCPAAQISAEQEDLLQQVCAMLGEQERLESLARTLQSKKATPDRQELKRFFKSAVQLLDGFDRILMMSEQAELSEEMQNWLKSVSALQTRMMKLFERFGLRAMDPVGKKVDLDRHEVIEVLRTDSIPDETVVEVRQKGYIFEGKVLRDAQVVVAKNERT